MASVVAFCNFKGGVGKTTLATTLWCHGICAGYSSVMVDADPQGDATKFAMGVVGMRQVPQGGGVEALASPAGHLARQVWQWNTCADLPPHVVHESTTTAGGLIVPATPFWSVQHADGLVLDTLPFSFVLVDTPPTIPTPLFRSIVNQATLVVAPVELEAYACQNVPNLLAEINAAGRGDLLANGGLRLVVNKRATCATHKVWESVLRNTYGDMMANTVIPRSAAWADLANPGSTYKPRSALAKVVAALWDELAEVKQRRVAG
jgi:chromosome partitioning protein